MKIVDTMFNSAKDAPKRVLGRYHRTVVKTRVEGDSLTEQQYKEESDVNEILRRYNCGQTLPPSRGDGRYGDVSECGDYASMMQKVVEANQQFEALPSHIRDQFGNNATAFYNFVSDPANSQALIDMGLAVKHEAPKEVVQKVEIVNPVTAAAAK